MKNRSGPAAGLSDCADRSFSLKFESMKKIFLFIGLSLLMNGTATAEALTVKHATAGSFSTELEAALTEASLTADKVTDLTIVSEGEAEMNLTDFDGVRTLAATLQNLDLSQAKLKGNGVPSGDPYSDKKGALRDMTALVNVVLPEDIVSIGGGAFARCTKLETVNLSNTITTIWNAAFKNCESLKITALPSGLTEICKETFQNCKNLAVSELPAGLVTVDDWSFNGCKAMTASVFPAALELIGENAFASSGVAFSEWTDKITTIEKSAFSGTKVTFTEWTPNIEVMPTGIFAYCYDLKDFTIPETTTTLGNQFYIPNAFYWTEDGKKFKRTITCRHDVPPVAKYGTDSKWNNTFMEDDWIIEKIYTLNVKKSAMETYKATLPYSKMTINPLTTTVPVEIEGGTVELSTELGSVSGTGGDLAVYEGATDITFTFGKDMLLASVSYNGEDLTEKVVDGVLTLDCPRFPSLLSITISDVSGVGEVAANGVKVYPNPATDVIYMAGNEGVAELYDLSGSLVRTATGETMDVADLATGVYVLRVGTESHKIVKK